MYVKNSPSPTRNLKQLARCPPTLSLGSNTGKTLRQMTGMENTKNSMDKTMNIFGDADLFAGQTGGSLAAPPNSVGESHSGDGDSYQHDNWTPYREKKPVEHTIQSNDHVFVPEVVIVNVELPGNPPRAHLVKTRDLIHSRDGESREN